MSNEPAGRHIARFDAFDRILHGLLITTFLGLSLTGIPLLFSRQAWASHLSRLFGGFQTAAALHRTFAVGLILCFLLHLGRIARRLLVKKDFGVLWGPHSMVPQPKDLQDMAQHILWFLGVGERPRFDRYTYWEKFDYWAVFWGMAIIGGSGLMLWFPKFFARFVPGWVFNVATLVHGEEALLAVGFIFTIHFFNSHLRPEKFPMDTVIFTGVVSADELAHERPAEYERLQATGGLDRLAAPPPSRTLIDRGFFLGGLAVLIGLILVALIIYTAVR
jgi:cytochrome b subunit of formate dehydrogenase